MASSLLQPRNLGFGCPQTLRPRRVPELSCFPSSSAAAAAASPPPCRFRSSSFRGARVRASGHRGQGGGVAEEEVSPEVPVLRRGQDDPAVPGEASEASVAGGDWRWPPWKGLPQRYKLIGTTSLAFVICNMDKVNLSVAIIPMSHQFGWSSSTAGLVQSSFFWGYTLSQLPGGWLAKIFGGRKILEIGVFAWSIATAFVPVVAGFLPGLVLSRILVGIGEGVSPSAATDIMARSIPREERSRAVGFVYGGLSVGSVLGLLLAPEFIQSLGWESVFYAFGFLGLAWCIGFQFLDEVQSSPHEHLLTEKRNMNTNGVPLASSAEKKSWDASLSQLSLSLKDIPWKAFFKSHAVWAMIYAHFCGSWGHYTCLSWLPTYFSEELSLNLTEAAWVSLLPPLASIAVTSIAATFADTLISNGVETTVVRKICQTIAFICPALSMSVASMDLGMSPWEIVAFLTAGLSLSSFALSGLYCTHQDISPEYASILLGITNTVGAVPGIVGVALAGYLIDQTHSWSVALFLPSIFFYLTGAAVWVAFASSKPQTFVKGD
ncbi:probable anion transporter 6, chloroplastic isoform X2 [Nymphaea colorata]|uniref:probable anion transporter 6, chloroplastic isoform X2 n=1 Tax=Nymphaea colorata TaxID=210225 RepID=UPI00129E34D9|nr:probable anion transporter 6, chloroplastic isoform X2 [Nymphaea colorata]